MDQHQPISTADDAEWLSSLVDSFGRTEQLHGVTCDQSAVSAAMARLQRPASPKRAKAARRARALEWTF